MDDECICKERFVNELGIFIFTDPRCPEHGWIVDKPVEIPVEWEEYLDYLDGGVKL